MPGAVPPAIDEAALPARRRRPDFPRMKSMPTTSWRSSIRRSTTPQDMGTRPQTLTAMADSPVGLATLMIDHDARSLELIARVLQWKVSEGLTRDDVLDNITLFWLTNTGGFRGPSLLGETSSAS